jgi:hypothetical protein
LKGTGFYPKLEYTWNCGNSIKPADSALATLTIKNTSNNSVLSIDRIRIALKNGIYEWLLLTDPANEKIQPQESKDFFVKFKPLNINPNLNSINITADDYDGTFTDYWKETKFDITCQAIGINYPSKHNFGNQLICSNNSYTIALENQSNDTDIDIDFSNATITGTKSNAFAINQSTIIKIKPQNKFNFVVTFNPTSTGLHTAKLTLPNNFGISIEIDITGTGTIFTLSSDKKSYSQLPGKKQEIAVKLNANDIAQPITSLNLQINYNKKQIKFDTTYFEDKIINNWTWNKPDFLTNGIINLAGIGSLPGNYNAEIAKFKFMFLLDTGTVSDLIYLSDYGCKIIPDTVATIATTPVCFDDGRKIYVQLNQSAILELPSPNPASDNLTLKFSCGRDFDLTVKIYNTMGVEVANVINKKYPSGVFEEKINLSGLLPGVYVLEFNDGSTKTIEKITITK